MVIDSNNTQVFLSGLTALVAFIAAIVGILIVDRMATKKTAVGNTPRFVFAMLAVGYTTFALGEVLWFLILKVFNETPSAGMPDFYWVIGSLAILIGFLTFTVHSFSNHGDNKKLLTIAGAAIIIFTITSFFMAQVNSAVLESGEAALSYYYPIVSSLIFIFSLSVYLFFEKIEQFRTTFLLLMLASLGFLGGDLFYTSYSAMNVYATAGIISDLFYIGAYLLSALAFMYLLGELKSTTQ